MKGVDAYGQQEGGHGGRHPLRKCVITHLPNASALKMDGAQARGRYTAAEAKLKLRRVGGRRARVEALGVSLGGTGSSADLGGSSEYSSENLEDWSGEGFHAHNDWTWVSRS